MIDWLGLLAVQGTLKSLLQHHSSKASILRQSAFFMVQLSHPVQKTKIMTSSPITSWEIDEETVETVRDFILGGSKITADGDYSHEIKRHLLLGRKPRQYIKNQRHYFANKGPSSQSYVFSSSHVWMGELEYKES